MRRRADIWNKYGQRDDFRLYDIYHWEAHPNAAHPEPTTLAQRVTHYEDYLQKFPAVIWPGLVEEPNNPVSAQFGLFNDYWGDQTYLVLVDKAGNIAYQNSFPKGIMDINKIYNDIDARLDGLLQEESLQETEVHNSTQLSLYEDEVLFTQPQTGMVKIFTPAGREVQASKIAGQSRFPIMNISRGYYLFQLETADKLYQKAILIK